MVSAIESGARTIVPLPGEATRVMRQRLADFVGSGHLTPESAQSLADRITTGLNILYLGGQIKRADEMAQEMQRLQDTTSVEPFNRLARSVQDVLKPLGTIVDQRV